MKPLISVQMSNYNKEDVISETIESVLGQSYDDFEFVIVDDGSTDRSPEIIKKYAKQDSRIKYYLLKKNEGQCVASNFGFEKANGEYMARIDSDDLWEERKLECQLEFMQSIENCEISFTGVNLIDEFGNSLNEVESDLLGLHNLAEMSREENLRFFFTRGNYLPHSTCMMKSEFQRKLGGFNLAYYQIHDFDYWLRAVKKSYLYKMSERFTYMRRFNNELSKNLSARTKEATIRYINEYALLKSHFFENMSDELFSSAFRCMFRNPDAKTPEEYACEKAFLLCGSFRDYYQPVLGLIQMEKLLNDRKLFEVLQHTYQYGTKTYYEEMKQHLFFDDILREDIQKKENELQKLNGQLEQQAESFQKLQAENQKLIQLNGHLREAIDIIVSSASWKITTPVRKLLDTVKQKCKKEEK